MRTRYIAAGALVGIFVGLALGLIFPFVLEEVFKIYSRALYESERNAISTSSPTYPTIFNVLPFLSLFTGLLGAISGWIVYKIKYKVTSGV